MQQQMQQLKLGDVQIVQQAQLLQQTQPHALHVQQAHTLQPKQLHAQLQNAQQDRVMQQQVQQLKMGDVQIVQQAQLLRQTHPYALHVEQANTLQPKQLHV